MIQYSYINQDYLKFSGADRLDLINRLSTNEVKNLVSNQTVKTILTSDKGRFIALLTLYNFGDFVFASSPSGSSKDVISFIEKYTIMDDFTSKDMSGTHETILFCGDNIEDYLKKIFNEDTSTNNNFFIINRDGHDAILSKNDDAFSGYYFIYAIEDKNFWNGILFNSDFEFTEIKESEYEVKRIELGIPKFGNEMSGLTNPLECGLVKYVSFTKGCYIGQEVIARLDAYDKINKHLVGIKASKDFSMDSNTKITTDNKECGFATSTVHSETYGSIGLGFVKTIFLDYNNDYKIKNGEDLIDCKIVRLPFSKN